MTPLTDHYLTMVNNTHLFLIYHYDCSIQDDWRGKLNLVLKVGVQVYCPRSCHPVAAHTSLLLPTCNHSVHLECI